MMLGISTQTFDINGFLILDYLPTSKLSSTARRVSRVATLDGGVELIDSGYTDSDRSFSIEISDITGLQIERLNRLMQQYPLLDFSCEGGFFSGVISELKSDTLPVTFTILVKEKHAS